MAVCVEVEDRQVSAKVFVNLDQIARLEIRAENVRE